jgi:MFS superfamily sulfate permease-like transporter
MKQLPHTVGYDADAESDLSFLEDDSQGTFSFLWPSLQTISPGGTMVALASLSILLLWETDRVKNHRFLSLVPGPLIAVLFGVGFNQLAQALFPALAIAPQHLVSLPVISGPSEFWGQLRFPDFSRLTDIHVYVTAATLALVGSLETLLSLEAVDKLDPLKRTAPTNQELKAQGLGNFLSGLIGGLPITAVIVRSSANINAGAHTKIACIVHGALLLLSVMFLSAVLNTIPLSCLAAVLLLTGYKLAKPKLVREQYEKGFAQFAPFAVTIAAILLTDLLKGMAIGMAVGLFFVLYGNYHSAFTLTRDGKNYLLRLQKDVSFLNKAPLRNILESIEDDSFLVIDGTRATFIDHDIMETLEDFLKAASDDNIRVELKNLRGLTSANGLVAA